MADADGESASALGIQETTHRETDAAWKTTTIGFYALNGPSVLRAVESPHKEQIVEVFEAIREQNPAGRILLVLDNFSSYIAEYTHTRAKELGITLVFLPIASPHLQPIKPVWGISNDSSLRFRPRARTTSALSSKRRSSH